jgi:hypothetical protein
MLRKIKMSKNLLCALCISVPAFSMDQEVPAEEATLLLKSKGDGMTVVFYTSKDEQACEGLTRAADVYDAELLRKKLLPFIANMQQKANALAKIYPEVTLPVQAGVPLQILGESNWSDKVGNMRSSGGCGPFSQQFMPQAGHKYMVQFEFQGGRCSQSLQDITDAAAPVPVESKPLQCRRPFFK